MSFKLFFKDKKTFLVKENVPVSTDYETWGSSLKAGVVQRSERDSDNDTYLFKKLSEALNITISQAVDLVKQRLFNVLFPNNTPNPANNENEYREAIFDALTTVVNELEQENRIRIGGGGSLKTWTARIISNLGQSQKEYGPNQARPRGLQPLRVRRAIDRAGDAVVERAPRETREEPALTDVQKLIKKTILTGQNIPVELPPQTRQILFGIQNLDAPNEEALLKYFKYSKKNLTMPGGGHAQYLALARHILPVGPVRMDNSGATRRIYTLISRDVPYFKFSYDFAIKAKDLITTGTANILKGITERYSIRFEDVYIFYYTNTDKFITRITGTTQLGFKIAYVEGVKIVNKKQTPSNKKLSDGNNDLFIKELRGYESGDLGDWRRDQVRTQIARLGIARY